MSAAILGALLCWTMPQTDLAPAQSVAVEVRELAPRNDGPGAWVRAADPRFPRYTGLEWLVSIAELHECDRP